MNQRKEHIELVKEKEYDPFLDIKCKNCGEPIPAKDLNINKTLAKCNDCGSVFTFEDDLFFGGRRGRPEFVMPEGTEVLKLLTSMEIELDWFKSMKRSNIAFEVMFTVLWNTLLFGMMIAMIVGGAGISVLFLTIHLVVGLGLAYRLLGKFINKTLIKINKDRISLEHGPIKQFTKKERLIKSSDIQQLYVSEYFTNVKVNDRPQKAYGLYAILSNNKKIRLINDCNKETALYLEQEIERYLNIEDSEISGELTE